MRNIKLVMEYDGTDFAGWQMQAEGRTVQGEITKVLEQVLQESITLIGAGRTDSGVHARAQVANFQTQSDLGTGVILSALSGLLPDDMYVYSVEEVPASFQARYDARERVYRYYITTKPAAIGRQYQWYVKYDLDMELMNRAALSFLGEVDFSAFSKHDVDVKHYRCTVTRSVWLKTQFLIIYEIAANRFLHGMVRALVGTMVDVGRGYLALSDLPSIIGSGDRRRAGMAAPPQGLFLEQIRY
jgi:tRNA pseudouridine38-40 synthase